MSVSGRGSEPGRSDDLGTRGTLEGLPAPRAPDGGVSRNLERLHLLRSLLILVAVVLAALVGWSIFSRRPHRSAVLPPQSPAQTSGEPLQTIEKFKFTSTLSGEPAYTILADRLTGIAGGLHTLEGIRSIQIMRPGGKVLTGSAARGTFVENESAQPDRIGSGHVVLEGRVHIEGTGGEQFDSERVEYFQVDGRLLSPGPCTFRLRPEKSDEVKSSRSLSGRAGRLEYEMQTQELRLGGGVALTLEEPGAADTIVLAESAEAAGDGSRADFRGAVSVQRDQDRLTAPVVHIERSGDGAFTHLVAGPGVRGRLTGPPPPARGTTDPAAIRPAASTAGTIPGSAPPDGAASRETPGNGGMAAAGGTPSRPVLLAADRLEITETSPAGERTVHLTGAASVEDEAEPGSPAGRRIQGDEISIRDPGRGLPRPVHAEGGVMVVFPPGPGETSARTLSCRVLDAVSAPDGKLTKAEAVGQVKLQAGARTGSAERATLVGEARVELRGGRPRVEEAERSLVADEIDLLSDPRQVTGRGGVRTRFVPREGAASGPFRPGKPVDVSADTAVLSEQPSRAEFTGKVLARQEENVVSSKSLILNDTEKTARAEGTVSLRTFRKDREKTKDAAETTGKASITEKTPPTRPVPTGSQATSIPVQIDADSLFYDGIRKSARFEGHALYREPGYKLSATRITTVGMSAGDEGGGPTETLAEGNVVFEGEGKRGTADAALYRSDERKITLEGKQRLADVVETATGRTWRGPSLTWSLSPDSIPLVSGESGRSRIVGSAAGPGQDRVGKKTDRRRAR